MLQQAPWRVCERDGFLDQGVAELFDGEDSIGLSASDALDEVWVMSEASRKTTSEGTIDI